VLAEAALASSSRRPSDEEATRLRRLAGDLSQAETLSIVLVQAEAGAPELKARLARDDKSLREPDIAAPSLGLYLFRTSATDAPQKTRRTAERLRAERASAVAAIRLRVDALAPGGAAALVTRELTLPSDGKVLALAP